MIRNPIKAVLEAVTVLQNEDTRTAMKIDDAIDWSERLAKYHDERRKEDIKKINENTDILLKELDTLRQQLIGIANELRGESAPAMKVIDGARDEAEQEVLASLTRAK